MSINRRPAEWLEFPTWEEVMASTPEQRRRWREQLLREWEENRAQQVREDDRADGKRGHWGD